MSTPSAGITRANIDTSHTRHATYDSATIPVFKGVETHRGDSCYFAGIARFAGKLYVNAQSGAVTTPDFINMGTSHYNGADKSKCKIFLYNDGTNYWGFGMGANSDIQYHANATNAGSHNFYFGNNKRLWIDSLGLKLRSYSAYGTIKVSSIATNNESGIGFFRDTNYTTANAWVVGQGLTGGAHTGNFQIYNEAGSGGSFKAELDTNGNLTIPGKITTTTINTGNGDCEVYPMNQAVRTTDDVTFDSATVTDLKVTDDATIDDDLNVTGTITGNLTGNVTGNCSGSSGSCTGNAATATNGVVTTGSYANPAWITSLNGFKVCDTGSFACTLKTSDVTVQQIGTAYFQKIGNLFICSFPRLIGISNSNTLVMYCTIPYYPKQVYAINTNYSTAYVMDNNASSIQLCYPSSTANGVVFTISGSTTGFTSSNNKGVTGPFTMTYVADY